MLSLPPTVRVFIAMEPVNMHGSFDSLAGAVRRLGLDPVDGHFYVMLNKRRHIAKVLWFDGSGWRILAKRLEKGTFELPEVAVGTRQIAVDQATLAALLDGIDLRAERRAWFERRTG
jgi:transposase